MSDVNLLSLFKPLADIILEHERAPVAEDDNQKEDSRTKLILEKHKDIFRRIFHVDWDRFQQIILHNSLRFDSSLHDKDNTYHQDVENVINALCHPKTVRSACDLYLQQIRDCNDKQ